MLITPGPWSTSHGACFTFAASLGRGHRAFEWAITCGTTFGFERCGGIWKNTNGTGTPVSRGGERVEGHGGQKLQTAGKTKRMSYSYRNPRGGVFQPTLYLATERYGLDVMSSFGRRGSISTARHTRNGLVVPKRTLAGRYGGVHSERECKGYIWPFCSSQFPVSSSLLFVSYFLPSSYFPQHPVFLSISASCLTDRVLEPCVCVCLCVCLCVCCYPSTRNCWLGRGWSRRKGRGVGWAWKGGWLFFPLFLTKSCFSSDAFSPRDGGRWRFILPPTASSSSC